ncbi:ribosomal subunit interface protein [Candidatus Curtissbacteria bacterium RIFCSPHIGHO2_12_41_11]|uniref:Ribosomal subunit interface protein n=2 Tax=Candidatus Curtissiibacteriota TaxID=1752717 RepID=A0A0G0YWU3_9BACT|nr:MAG: Ribosomal subunit interface protein [Candidatus Curtissbacteria bacterium GW2011_GWA2_41_24]OGD98994.1 MAG: ribosomal subunit interface protein [Candidatus Curtissbacteria bacterium RIFCSPHIGHO2_12_41_11]
MNIVISGPHPKKEPQLEEYARKKVQKLAKYHPKILQIDVRLIVKSAHRGQENDNYCEITAKVPGKTLEIVDSERTMDKAIDKAVDRMKRTLIKYREKKISKDHKKGIVRKILGRWYPQ